MIDGAIEIIKRRGQDMTGKCKWFNEKKGFGFLTGDDGNEVFVHYSGIVGMKFKTLTEGDSVKYDIIETERGLQAINVLCTSILITDGDEAYKITLLA